MMQKMNLKDNAVSPVVGVMLMLAVTIIIAAVVSGFAGGVAQGTSKAPQMSITAESRNGSYIIVDHMGGDSVSGSSIMIKTRIPSGTYKDMSYEVNMNNVTYLPTNSLLYDTSSYSWHSIQPGDKIKINWADAFKVTSYGPMAPSIGEPVNIEIFDSASGKVIATTQASTLP